MEVNGDILKTIFRFVGVSDVTAATDSPAARLTIGYTQYGKAGQVELTLGELVDQLTGGPAREAPQPDSGDQR